ncbi:hypothetical protein [Actinoplanes sp. M2I2]|uniref:hypothetical protein n=1 Tax=Actinoplanes sp. M2I2 TaxID=1734444 RepID=UPI002020F135|nr:hypothetical protein [Actinoplanes sp. M2I2]
MTERERDLAVSVPAGGVSAAVCSDPLNDEDGHCALELKDSHRRTSAPVAGQDEALDEAAVAVHRWVHDAGCVERTTGADGPCAGAGELSATEQDVAEVRRSLAAGGYREAVVRLGRDTDPTLPGALIYAVRVGEVCVLGDVTPPPDERWHEWYAGLLPDGRCLDA